MPRQARGTLRKLLTKLLLQVTAPPSRRLSTIPDELSLLYADPRDWERLSLDTEAVFALAAAAAVVATSSSFQRG